MTRVAYDRCVDVRSAEVRRLLERYLVEIVEAYNLCPWARGARLGQEVGVEILWGTPNAEAFAAAGTRLLQAPRTRVAMVIAPELGPTISELREIRQVVIPLIPSAGIADFHPASPIDLASPPRLVPYLRCSPDPMLQLVPLSILDSVRGSDRAVVDVFEQAEILSGRATLPRGDIADDIAAANHTRVAVNTAAIAARFADIAADRKASYERVGITAR
ncbi:MAG: hypothetical protein JWO36_4481 [Myxococcales bacterium]|nr:hypothetical protein [Myxococcales bacterium]